MSRWELGIEEKKGEREAEGGRGRDIFFQGVTTHTQREKKQYLSSLTNAWKDIRLEGEKNTHSPPKKNI